MRVTVDRTRWGRTGFRVTAFGEAISWAGLLVAMAFKHVIADSPARADRRGHLVASAYPVAVAGARTGTTG